MLEKLKQEVLQANLELDKKSLVIHTWGNASGFSRSEKLIAIKPSGVNYRDLTVESIVLVDLEGNVVEGSLKPSSDTLIHIELYKNFDGIGGVAHTHSSWAAAWAQAGRPIPCFGTTHADYFRGEVPCTDFPAESEVEDDYEQNTGRLITGLFSGKNHLHTPGALAAGHGPFTWGKTASEAVHNSEVLEEIAKTAFLTLMLDGKTKEIPNYLLCKHFDRKHGGGAYYGQEKNVCGEK